jgi:hypothetical protein
LNTIRFCLIPGARIIDINLSEPLHDDQEIHVTEKTKQYDKSGDNLAEQSGVVREVDTVLTLIDDTQTHVEHSKDHRHLHLNVVSDSQFVLFGDGPGRFLAEWVLTSNISLWVEVLPVCTFSESFIVERFIWEFSTNLFGFQLIGLRLICQFG